MTILAVQVGNTRPSARHGYVITYVLQTEASPSLAKGPGGVEEQMAASNQPASPCIHVCPFQASASFACMQN